MKKMEVYVVSAAMMLGTVSAEVPVCTYDELSNKNISKISAVNKPLSAKELRYLAQNQLTLCMIGDSVTWAEDGDHFRGELLKLVPELAFAGTHTAVLGYSHAGEGGDSTVRVLQRLNDRSRIPDAPYYHLLIGINDCNRAKQDEQSSTAAEKTAANIIEIVRGLLARKCTKKVFLGSVLPSPFDADGNSTVRERTGALLNSLLRKDLKNNFPDGRVVWIEYELPLRKILTEWKKTENLRGVHPTAKGYRYLAEIAAPVLKKEMEPEKISADAGIGVEIVNLWDPEKNMSNPLYPGWYTLSMKLENCQSVKFRLFSLCDDPSKKFDRTCQLEGKSGSRVHFNFMTGYQNYGYTLAPFAIEFISGRAVDIQIEKTRPLGGPSKFGSGRFVDAVSPIAAGEKLVPLK